MAPAQALMPRCLVGSNGCPGGCHLQCVKQVGGGVTSVSKSYGT